MSIPNYDNRVVLFNLKDGETINMKVDGSITPKEFKFAPPAGEIWIIEGLRIFLLDGGVMAHNVFGGLAAALDVGFTVEIKKSQYEGGIESVISSIKDNVDLLTAFSTNISTGNSTSAFLNDDDWFMGTLKFGSPIRLCGDEGDLIKIVIKDDLTGITRFESTVMAWEFM